MIWQCIATFGFYAATKLPRREIASRIQVTATPLARYISAIRSAFGVESHSGRDTKDNGRQIISQYATEYGLTLTREHFLRKN